MARYAPNGTLLEVLGEGEEEDKQQDPKGNALGDKEGTGNDQGGGPPCQVRGQGRQGAACRCSSLEE